MDQPTEGAAHVASHRMPDSDRPRRPVPAWVTAPFTDGSTGLEAPPAPAASAPAPQSPVSTAPASSAPVSVPVPSAPEPVDVIGPVPASAPSAAVPALTLDPNAVVPDYPPSEEHLPPAPTSPALHTAPLGSAPVPTSAPMPVPVSPVDAVREPALAGSAQSGPAHQGPVVPRTGQPRFSVPGLEHVVVEGGEPEPVGPVGYRTPARFARTQAGTEQASTVPAAGPTFEAVIAAAPAPSAPATRALPAVEPSEASDADQAEASLQADAPTRARRTLRATPGAVVGAVAGVATIGLAALWFSAPATVHVVGVLLGVVALVCSLVTLRKPATTWQRPVALLGAVLGGVGTLVLLWAVASAVLPMAGVTLPDVTGTGTVPTLAP